MGKKKIINESQTYSNFYNNYGINNIINEIDDEEINVEIIKCGNDFYNYLKKK